MQVLRHELWKSVPQPWLPQRIATDDHLAKGAAFKARSENREPPTKSTKESAKVAALEKELERYRQAESKSVSAQQETDAPTKAAYKMAIRALSETCRRLHCSPMTTRQSRHSKQDWTRRRRPVTNPCPSARGFEQGQNQIAMHERDISKAANDPGAGD